MKQMRWQLCEKQPWLRGMNSCDGPPSRPSDAIPEDENCNPLFRLHWLTSPNMWRELLATSSRNGS
jgi:hypothetical protein